MENESLYDRLGGETGIASLVDDIVAAHMENPAIRARFLPYREDPERLEEIKGHLARFLAAGAGGPQEYSGRTMVETHRGMNIAPGEYLAAVDDIMGVLTEHAIDERTRKDVLAVAYSLKDEIVRV